VMINNSRHSNQKLTGGRKRTGKSLESKSTGNFAKKSFVKTDSRITGKYSDITGKSNRKYSANSESRVSRKKIEDKTANKSERKFTAKTEGVTAKKYFGQNPDRTFNKYKNRSKRITPVKAGYSDEMRLNRFIANSGVCSRREADKYILSGVVTVNGEIITELGTKVSHGDEVRFDGRKLKAEKKVYLLLNKPKDFVTTTDDPHAEKTVMDLVKNACDERIYPVGRLDRNTTGVLLFTNDGDLSKKLTHPSHNMKKIYQVTLNKPLTKEHLKQIAEGVELDDGYVAADAISFINPDDRTEIGVEIHSGKNRIIRRIFEHMGYNVKKLDRVYFAGLTKKSLPRGKWRLLSEKEVHFLKMN
jgi:23S rRNA pseudouridine2605 synthase